MLKDWQNPSVCCFLVHIRAMFWNHIGIDKFEQESKYEMNFSSRRQMSFVKLNVLALQVFYLAWQKGWNWMQIWCTKRPHRPDTLKYNYHFSKLHDQPSDRPFPSCPSLCQSEAKCYFIDMKLTFYSHVNKSHFHKKDFAREKRGILELGNGQLTNW